MLQFSKLILALSFIIILYSISKMLSGEDTVFYLGTLIISISVFVLSAGILSMSMIHKKSSRK